ncbi:MAG: hypothetical protein LCH26_07035 [Proteobacteria bacterium]|nr:hypothetical protein [Pseudomonadota bacterium]
MKKVSLALCFLSFHMVYGSTNVTDDFQGPRLKRQRLGEGAQNPQTLSPGRRANLLGDTALEDDVTEEEVSSSEDSTHGAPCDNAEENVEEVEDWIRGVVDLAREEADNLDAVQRLMKRLAVAKGQADGERRLSPLCFELINCLKAPLPVPSVLDACALLAQLEFREGGYTPLWFHVFATSACLTRQLRVPARLYLGLGTEGFRGQIQGISFDPETSLKQALMGFREPGQGANEASQIDALLELGRHGYTGILGGSIYAHRSDVLKDAYALAFRLQDHRRMFESLMALGNADFIGHLVDKTIERPVDALLYAYELSNFLSAAEQTKALMGIARYQSRFEAGASERAQSYKLYQMAAHLACESGLASLHAQCLLSVGILDVKSQNAERVFARHKYASKEDCLMHAYEIARGCGARAAQVRAIAALSLSSAHEEALYSLTPQTLDVLYAFIQTHMNDRWVLKYLLPWRAQLNGLTLAHLEEFLGSVMIDRHARLDPRLFANSALYLEACANKDYMCTVGTAVFMQRVAQVRGANFTSSQLATLKYR